MLPIKAIKLTPDYQEAHYFLSLSYFLTSRYKKALISIKESIRLDPSNAESHYTLGQIYMKLGRFNKAITLLQTAMRIQPELPQIKSQNSDRSSKNK
jgi:cytochrome c-type biogenesis protein CcmH/NrfG